MQSKPNLHLLLDENITHNCTLGNEQFMQLVKLEIHWNGVPTVDITLLFIERKASIAKAREYSLYS